MKQLVLQGNGQVLLLVVMVIICMLAHVESGAPFKPAGGVEVDWLRLKNLSFGGGGGL